MKRKRRKKPRAEKPVVLCRSLFRRALFKVELLYILLEKQPGFSAFPVKKVAFGQHTVQRYLTDIIVTTGCSNSLLLIGPVDTPLQRPGQN